MVLLVASVVDFEGVVPLDAYLECGWDEFDLFLGGIVDRYGPLEGVHMVVTE